MKYADSDILHVIEKGYNEKTRSLNFHSLPITAERLQKALDIIDKYNDFDSKRVGNALRSTFKHRVEYIVGRELSVVIYVVRISSDCHIWLSDLNDLKEKAMVDEISFIRNKLRLWWD